MVRECSARRAAVTLENVELTVDYTVAGEHRFETETDPEEWPEIEIVKVVTAHEDDITALLEFGRLHEALLEKVTAFECEASWAE